MTNADKTKERAAVSQTVQNTLRDYAGTMWPGKNTKGRIKELVAKLEFTHRRVVSLWKNERTARLHADELERIEALRDELRKEEATRDDIQTLQARISRLEAALFETDQDFHSVQMAGYRQAVDGRRGGDDATALGPNEAASAGLDRVVRRPFIAEDGLED